MLAVGLLAVTDCSGCSCQLIVNFPCVFAINFLTGRPEQNHTHPSGEQDAGENMNKKTWGPVIVLGKRNIYKKRKKELLCRLNKQIHNSWRVLKAVKCRLLPPSTVLPPSHRETSSITKHHADYVPLLIIHSHLILHSEWRMSVPPKCFHASSQRLLSQRQLLARLQLFNIMCVQHHKSYIERSLMTVAASKSILFYCKGPHSIANIYFKRLFRLNSSSWKFSEFSIGLCMLWK